MSWIAEYDTQGREFPTCVHVTKTTGTMTHGVTYVPIEDGKAVRAENDKLRELVRLMVRSHAPISPCKNIPCGECPVKDECDQEDALMRELGVDA